MATINMEINTSEEDLARVKKILDAYNAYVAQMEAENRAKPDMIANRCLKDEWAPARKHGHMAGVKPGDKFLGKGQLAILSLHSQIPRGIDHPPIKSDEFKLGAYAIVMSGGYVDDADAGLTFWYTGEGGQSKGQQAVDQRLEGGNLALHNSWKTQTPVRVFRALPEDGKRMYIYDGLYRVKEMKCEASKDGPKVFRFLMEGITGHSLASATVTFKVFNKISDRLRAKTLAGHGTAPVAKRPRQQGTPMGSAASRQVIIAQLKNRYGRNLICEDISNGTEKVPIPLINEVNTEGLPEDFKYISDYTWHAGVKEQVAPVLEFLDKEMDAFVREEHTQGCGILFNKYMKEKDETYGSLPAGYELHAEETYNPQGLLMVTDPCGLHECSDKCTSRKCLNNRHATGGVVAPLEVFMTKHKGWGVRCREHLHAGAYVCSYIGELSTDFMAEKRQGQDHYLFNLDFFVHIYQEIARCGLDHVAKEIPIHKIPPLPSVTDMRNLLAEAAQKAAAGPSISGPNGTAAVGDAAGPGDAGAHPAGAEPAACDAHVGGPATPHRDRTHSAGDLFNQPVFSMECPESAKKGAGGQGAAPQGLDAGDNFHGLLVIDALKTGNVARFINHSCEGNLAIQAVFVGKYRNTLLYHCGLYAQAEIPAGTELTYNYGYFSTNNNDMGKNMVCHCGAPKCSGKLM